MGPHLLEPEQECDNGTSRPPATLAVAYDNQTMNAGSSKVMPSDDTLARSCGQTQPISLSVTSAQEKKLSKFVIDKPFAFIGRHAGCDLCLPHADVTKQHLYLQVLDGRLFCVDQASRSGVSWKDKQRLYGWLDVGQWVEVGPFRITLLNRVGEPDPATRDARNTAPFQMRQERNDGFRLEVNGSLIVPLQRQMTTIGRSEYCNITFDQEDISRMHANVLRTSDSRYWLLDLISRTGLRVNGERCHVCQLKDGDIIRIGTNTIRFLSKQSSLASKSGPIVKQPPPPLNVTVSEAPPSSDPLVHLLDQAKTPPSAMPETAEDLLLPETATLRPEEPRLADEVKPVLEELPNPQETDGSDEELAPEVQADPFEEVLKEVAPPPEYPMIPRPKAELVRPPSPDAIARSAARPPRVNDRKQLARIQRRLAADNAMLMNMMVDHMRQMQAEMMTQMRMNMDMMMQCVHKMQKQQSELVRAELAQLAKINTEILQLKRELLSTPAPQPEPARPRDAAASRPAVEPPPAKTPPPERPTPIPAKPRGKAVVTPAESDSSRHTHMWITERIARLETERKSRWQKIKEAVTGQP
jgi:hypothetical protein